MSPCFRYQRTQCVHYRSAYRPEQNRTLEEVGEAERRQPVLVATLLHNFQSIGFTLAPALVERLLGFSPEQLLRLAEDVLPVLVKEVGGHRRYQPMYPNFPQQVMEASVAELFLNAHAHYYGDAIGARILPEYTKEPREAALPAKDLKVVGLAPEDAAHDLARNLVASNASLSASDRSDLRVLLRSFRAELATILPEQVPYAETKALVCESVLQNVAEPGVLLDRYLKTATDVLRFLTELSDGDTSLAGRTRYRSFSRRERRCLLGLLERCERPLEDMVRHRQKWLRVGERLHPREYERKFPRAAEAFFRLRSGESVQTFASRVERHLARGEVSAAVQVLGSRPGEFARRLDHLIRLAGGHTEIGPAFKAVADRVSTPVLLQVLGHFRERGRTPKQIGDVEGEAATLRFFARALRALRRPTPSEPHPTSAMRTIFPKGDAGKLVRIPNTLKLLAPEAAAFVVATVEETLERRFAELPAMGRTFVDPALRDFPVPFSQRSASKSLRTVARGSRLPLPSAKVLRFFLWWREGRVGTASTGRVDIDLSTTFYDAAWHYLEHVSYTRLRSSSLGAVHSGDITSAPKGACEFVDVECERARAAGARYVVVSVQSFTSHPFCDLPECFMGWMARDEAQSGEVFEPSRVQDRVDLAANRRIAVPAVIDLEAGQLVWADLALRANPSHHVAIESNQRGLVHYGVAITTLVKPTLFDLFSLHQRARGREVESAAEAEVVFSLEEGVTPFDFETIAAQYLA